MIPELPVQPTTAESAFFERAKLHLSRKELAPDKPPGSRRHTPYVEFLKCLHLFGAGILNKDELLLLLRGLFMQGHAPKSGINAGGGASNPAVANDAQELLREFEEVLVSRGHYANQEEASKTKSKYGDKQIRDMDLSGCERLTPSYRTYPPDYPMNKFFFHSGQSGMDATVLNSDTLCVPEKKNRIWSPEEYDGPTKRHNPYEEAMLLAEDERFEVDMAIQRNIMAMRQVEPIAEEVTQLRENEEKDGQPIGRMHYKLRSRQLNNAQINAIARLYGDSGDEVLQHLVRNPVAVLPIVFNRLKQKDVEWREAKKELNKKWEAIYDANHEGSLDATCWFHKRDLERSFDEKKLVKQAKNCQDFVKEPSVLASRAATKDYHPQFLRGSTDSDSLLYQPHMKLPMSPEMPHQDAYHLIKTTLMKLGTKVDHEPVFRVWTEFMASFFSFPSDFVIDDAREGNCKKQALALKYNTGQKVMTSFGQGEILSVSEGTGQSTLRYKVRLPFGIGFVRPESIFQSANGPGFLARNGDQVKVSETEFPGSDYRLDNKYKLVFVEEIVYKFLRIYSLLVSILHDTKSRLLQTDSDQMDTTVDNKTFGPAYTAYLSKLKEVMVSQPDLLAFERFCRATCKKRVGQLTVLPKIVDSCARLLVEISKDDVLLSAYDFSMWGERDPVKLRSQCLSVSDESSYRVQISDDNIFFAYVDPDQDLMALPEDDEVEDEMDDDAEDGEIEESGEDLNPDDDGQPDSKRQKLK